MQSLIDNLSAFNRRERFFVVGWALDNPFFNVGDEFREQVRKEDWIGELFHQRYGDPHPIFKTIVPGWGRNLRGPRFLWQPNQSDGSCETFRFDPNSELVSDAEFS